jgi:hypothetical protein
MLRKNEIYRLTTATCRRNSVPTFVDRGESRGRRSGSPTVVNLSFLDRTLDFQVLIIKVNINKDAL